jgi:hypothetical protein
MDSAAIVAPPTKTPLSREHYRELADAKPRFAKVRAAARVAAFNGWTMGIVAALSAPFAFFSVAGLVMAAGFAVIAYIEFRGRRRLLQYDPSAAALLGWNQIGLLTLILAYCLWQLWTGLSGPSPLAAELQSQPELEAALGSLDEVDSLYRSVVIAFYGLVIALSVVVQGLNAVYYFTRRPHVVACLRDTPAWVLDLEQRASGN